LKRSLTILDMVGNLSPMWSATSVSEAPSLRCMKDRVRNCGAVRSGLVRLRICLCISRMTRGTVSSSSRAQSSVEIIDNLFHFLIIRTPN